MCKKGKGDRINAYASPTKETIKRLREEYPPGTRIVLDSMDDPHAPPSGTKGTVAYVDDQAKIGMNWDNGSSLSLMPSLDSFSKEPELKKTKKRSWDLGR